MPHPWRGLSRQEWVTLDFRPTLSITINHISATVTPTRRHLLHIATTLVLSIPTCLSTAQAPQPPQQTSPQPTPTQLQPTVPKPAPAFYRNIIILDPAHGGPDAGARLANGAQEKDVTLAFSARLRTLLAAAGFTVLSTRDSDPSALLTTDQRASVANHARPLACLINRPLEEIEGVVSAARFIKLSMGDEEGFTIRSRWEELRTFTVRALKTHHESAPLSPGLEMESLRTRLPYEVTPRSFRAIVDRIGRDTEIIREESVLRLKTHKVKLGGDAGELGTRVEAALIKAHFQPPDLRQLGEELKLPSSSSAQLRTILGAMEREGRVVKIASDLYYGRAAFDTARARLLEHLKKNPEITAAIYRDLLGASRKFAIALLDHFDHTGVTTRVGDIRRLRREASA